MLRDLVALGEVGVEVVFAGVLVVLANRAAQREPQTGSGGHDAPVCARKRSGQPQRNRAYLGIRCATVVVAFAGISLTLGTQLNVYL